MTYRYNPLTLLVTSIYTSMLNIMITHNYHITPYYLQHAMYIHVTTLDKGNVYHMQYHNYTCTMLSPHLHTVQCKCIYMQCHVHVQCCHLHTVYGTVQMYTDAGTDSTMYMYIHVTFIVCIHSLSLLKYKATILGTVSHIICSLRYFHIQENVAHCCEQIVSL